MTALHLKGLLGNNPMAYFAAYGVLAAVTRTRTEARARLRWETGVVPHPVLELINFDEEALIEALHDDLQAWSDAPALNFGGFDDVKLDAAQQRAYLLACRSALDGGRSAGLGSALIAEGTFAKSGDGKPTDLHFTAGQQRFLAIARTLQTSVTVDDLREAVVGSWQYRHIKPTFGWDLRDDRVYAYTASNPSKADKPTVPGADWLALIGLAAFPVRGAGEQASPPGASGSWKRGMFQWGVWSDPLGWSEACALVRTGFVPEQVPRLGAGVFRVYSSRIRRADQGGYGSFSPSSVLWDATHARAEP